MKKVFLFLSVISLVAFSSCSDDDSSSSDSSSDVLVKRIVTQQEDPDGFNYTRTFSYNGNKLNQVVYNDGYTEKFYYNGNDISKIEYIFEGDIEFIDVFSYTNGELTEYRYQDMFDDYEERSIFVYNSDNTITETYSTGEIGHSDPTPMTRTLTVTNNEITKIVSDGTTYNISLDGKNSPFKNVTGYHKIVYAFAGDYELHGRSQNISSIINATAGQNYMINTFQYNNSDYPTSSLSTAIFDDTMPNVTETMTTQYFYE